jgi:NitT/TauT family transport system permease protein
MLGGFIAGIVLLFFGWLLVFLSGNGRIKQPISNRAKIIWGVAGVSVLVVGYSFLSYRQHQRNPDDTTLPNISQLAHGFMRTVTPPEEKSANDLRAAFGVEKQTKSFWQKVQSTWLYKDSAATYGRLIKGLVWGCMISIVLGTLMGCYEWLGSFLMPPLAFLAKTPGTAMLAVFFVVVGTGEPMFATMIGFGVLPTLTQTIYLAAKEDLHREQIDKAYTLGADNTELICNVVFPKILPKIIDNVRLQIGPAMVFLIAAEMLVGDVGMGYQIRMQQRLVQMNVVYNYLFILGVTGLLMDRGMIYLRRWMCPWFEITR